MTLPPHDAPKPTWRAWAREVRAGQPNRSAELCTHLAAFLHARGARRVLAYYALPGEPDVGTLVAEFELLTTRARFRPTPHLTLHPWETATEVSRFGVRQPPAGVPRVGLETVDAVLLPGLAFDHFGVRLGYGGGFYDRLLPDFSGLTVGVVWEALVVDELPSETHDLRVGFLATESGISPTQP
ncbi:5-formyltetrahydrofolate cyclo-ligase [Deinococcus sp. NW-56]|uniref:5-formyltetrahydrofolate cyclo-ligase n=1 Tax=Deinococcus sp. NW-56 TaxID=2080419 RepID=UPI000CF4BF4B|nr:5-formyltetrahydrofolate cyclo-ligase [Deinococcus sp. NW-56]